MILSVAAITVATGQDCIINDMTTELEEPTSDSDADSTSSGETASFPDSGDGAAVNDVTEDEWWEKFRPIKNPFDDHASFDGHMFETYGEELEYVRAQPAEKIWTFIEGDDVQLIGAGYSYVNRLGYFITEEPWITQHEEIILEDLTDGRIERAEESLA